MAMDGAGIASSVAVAAAIAAAVAKRPIVAISPAAEQLGVAEAQQSVQA
jgi:galactitol-specific phosphotransferase system IIB component